ncbi:ABC transporter permease [Pontixanthobacter aquaemixtae]|uniref:ABC transporter permease n=1 Tax=Pontixanthobacter aquaemixtae TaxID=1958940 RepID=A0A844ZT98_9SPHN|nr:ABC transporter permease [Pontixanthobacter aquaemixtae]MXO91541.1 ABC transporter permease [Pontixanthobacter aquaemixtae]
MSNQTHEASRLSTLQAAYVIARRDFLAILFSRAFLFFLLGPLFPIVVGGLAGGIGSEVQRETAVAEIGIAMNAADTADMISSAEAMRENMGSYIPPMVALTDEQRAMEPAEILRNRVGNYAAIVSGTPEQPTLTAPEGQIDKWRGQVGLVAASNLGDAPRKFPELTQNVVQTSGASEKSDRIKTAQGGQMLLFLLTMLLGGMVLSNLVEEKGNKIIEVLAAAIPMDAVFFGKLFAMLGVSFVGILVWGGVGGLIFLGGGASLGSFAAPAVGWPIFLMLGVVYFAMGYLILGSLFLAIGSMAATVREVQTLSMPVTMLQLMVFFFATYAMAKPGSTIELAAAIFPFSSPFAMLARAAQDGALWPHALAIAWQIVAVTIFVKLGATLFRRRVMKSGPRGANTKKWRFWHRKSAALASAEAIR